MLVTASLHITILLLRLQALAAHWSHAFPPFGQRQDPFLDAAIRLAQQSLPSRRLNHEKEPPICDVAEHDPFLWVAKHASHPKSTVYLQGTMHVPLSQFGWFNHTDKSVSLPVEIEQALEASTRIFMEIALPEPCDLSCEESASACDHVHAEGKHERLADALTRSELESFYSIIMGIPGMQLNMTSEVASICDFKVDAILTARQACRESESELQQIQQTFEARMGRTISRADLSIAGNRAFVSQFLLPGSNPSEAFRSILTMLLPEHRDASLSMAFQCKTEHADNVLDHHLFCWNSTGKIIERGGVEVESGGANDRCGFSFQNYDQDLFSLRLLRGCFSYMVRTGSTICDGFDFSTMFDGMLVSYTCNHQDLLVAGVQYGGYYRDVVMAKNITRLAELHPEETLFFAIGAAHFLYNHPNIMTILCGQGWTVERVGSEAGEDICGPAPITIQLWEVETENKNDSSSVQCPETEPSQMFALRTDAICRTMSDDWQSAASWYFSATCAADGDVDVQTMVSMRPSKVEDRLDNLSCTGVCKLFPASDEYCDDNVFVATENNTCRPIVLQSDHFTFMMRVSWARQCTPPVELQYTEVDGSNAHTLTIVSVAVFLFSAIRHWMT